MNEKKSLSTMFSTARIYCLISIVAAHLYFPGTFSTIVLFRLGTIGVVGFLAMAGYFYRPSKFGSFFNLLKKKVITLILPWFVMGMLTWGYNALLNPYRRSAIELVKWVLGNGTFLYYMPVLMFCFVLFYKNNTTTLSVAILVNVASIVLTAAGVVKPIIETLHITSYLNPLNWIGFFAAGMLLQRINEERILFFLKRYRYLFIVVFVICFVFALVFEDIKLDYFSYLAIPYEVVGILAVFSVSTFVITDKKFFSYLSSSSFTIYLTHMIFIGVLDGYLAKVAILRLLSPFVIIALAFGFLMLGLYISRKIKLEKIYCLITGLRV